MESKWQQLSGLMTNRSRSIKSDVDLKSKENNTNNMDDNQQEANNKDSLVVFINIFRYDKFSS